ncbi:MAG: ABC transporter permease [Fluviicola sp.]
MKKLFQIEWIKIKKLNSVKIILAIYMVMIPLWMLVMNLWFTKLNEAIPLFPDSKELWSFPSVWRFVTYSSSYFNQLLMAVIIVILTSNEFASKTLRQHIIDGMTKRQIIYSKFLVVLFFSIISTCYVFLIGTIFGMSQGGGLDLYHNIHYIGLYFVQTLCYFGLAFLVSILLQKPALSIILFYGIIFFETIIGFFIPNWIYAFFPLNNFAKLTPLPHFDKIFGGMSWSLQFWQVVLIALFYMFLLYAIALFRLNRRDL